MRRRVRTGRRVATTLDHEAGEKTDGKRQHPERDRGYGHG
jgi:hypothetical protein